MGTFVRFLGTPGLVIAFELGKALAFRIFKGQILFKARSQKSEALCHEFFQFLPVLFKNGFRLHAVLQAFEVRLQFRGCGGGQ